MGKIACDKCGTSFVSKTAICEKCKKGYALCNSCPSFWKSHNCPNCGTGFANWKIV